MGVARLGQQVRSSVERGARKAVRDGRRAGSRIAVRRLSDDGGAPGAVRAALLAAGQPPSPAEQAWIDRIESKRRELSDSTQTLDIEDFGAGANAQFDTAGEFDTHHTTRRTVGEMTGASKSPHWAYLLFRLVRSLRPQTCLEMGACVGISASYQAAALELNGQGRLVSLEGAASLADRSQQTLQELGLGDRADVRVGRFTDTLADALTDLAPLGLAFVDGHHVESATLAYAEEIAPHLGPEAVVVFDDVNWSPGMQAAWRTIRSDPRYALTVDLRSVGLAVVSATSQPRRELSVYY